MLIVLTWQKQESVQHGQAPWNCYATEYRHNINSDVYNLLWNNICRITSKSLGLFWTVRQLCRFYVFK